MQGKSQKKCDKYYLRYGCDAKRLLFWGDYTLYKNSMNFTV